MKDKNLIFKLRIFKAYEDGARLVQPNRLLQAAATNTTDDDVKKDVDDDGELEEGEIREDEEVPDKDQENKSETPNKKICPYCNDNREFSSGKALGGHLRTHKEHQPKTKPKIKRKIEQSSDPNPARGQSVYACTLCGKNFSSRKAVFGHMRSHPERVYRGMQDPGSISGQRVWVGFKGNRKRCAAEAELEAKGEADSSPSSISHRADGGAEDDTMAVEPVCNGSVGVDGNGNGDYYDDGGERKVSNVLPEQEDDHNTHKAAIMRIVKKDEIDEIELYFLQGFLEQLTTKSNFNNPPNYKKPPTFPSLNSNSKQLTTKSNLKHPPTHNKTPTFPSLNSNSEAPPSRSSKKEVVVKKKRRNGLVRHNDEDQKELDRWKCKTCNKTFKSHQALGGHISSHRKASGGNQRSRNVRPSSEPSPETRSNNFLLPSQSSPERSSVHRNNNSRSPDLSPEKRNGDVGSSLASSSEQMSSERGNYIQSKSESLPEEISNNGAVLGFDLNSLPEEMPEEDVDQPFH